MLLLNNDIDSSSGDEHFEEEEEKGFVTRDLREEYHGANRQDPQEEIKISRLREEVKKNTG